jgi:two-component system, OmpR family, KDP operon response regulator KdpE
MHSMRPPPSTVLVVEDNAELRRLIREQFELAGFQAYEAKNGMDGLKSAARDSPALITLDVDLPDISGVEVLDRLRSSSSAPVIILSGRSKVADRVHLLGLGAHDYLVKPFDMDDLLMRARCAIQNYLRESAGEPCLSVGSLSIDLDACSVRIDEDPLELTPAQYRVLRMLAERAGNVVTDHHLLADLWGPATEFGDLHRLRILVRNLRERIESHLHGPRVLRELGVGYRLVECCVPVTGAVDRSLRIG